MQTGYCNAVWNDIKNSPGWFGKLALLALVTLIPVFGWIVVYGYLFGWARDLAWNVHAPLPARVFGNEDGKLYSRGFFALVIVFVCTLVPCVFGMVTDLAMDFRFSAGDFAPTVVVLTTGLSSMLFALLTTALSFFASVFSWVGIMRMSVYGRLAPGLQFGKIWAMMRHDAKGLLRILGMSVLLSLALGFVASILIMVLMFLVVIVGLVIVGGGLASADVATWGATLTAGGLFFAVILVSGALVMALSVFVIAMVARALGYWMQQFDVPVWRGQDDPMPFELAASAPVSQPPISQP